MATIVYPTLAQIRQRVRFYIDEPVQANFLDSDINWAINDNQQDVAVEIAQVDEKYFVNPTPIQVITVALQQYYPLDPSCYKIVRLEDVQTGLMIPFTELEAQNNFFQTALPPLASLAQTGFSGMLVGNSIGLTPMPTASGQIFQYWFIPFLPDMVDDTDICSIPRSFVDLLAIQAAIDCYIKDEADTTPLERKYARKLEQLKRAARDRQQQNPKKVQRVGDSSQYPGWTL